MSSALCSAFGQTCFLFLSPITAHTQGEELCEAPSCPSAARNIPDCPVSTSRPHWEDGLVIDATLGNQHITRSLSVTEHGMNVQNGGSKRIIFLKLQMAPG